MTQPQYCSDRGLTALTGFWLETEIGAVLGKDITLCMQKPALAQHLHILWSPEIGFSRITPAILNQSGRNVT